MTSQAGTAGDRKDRLRVVVLGAAAGGGLPQWNCSCEVCRAVWDGRGILAPQTQSSIAVSVDGAHWVVFNASPDIRHQILNTPALHPAAPDGGRRHSPIHAVVLTNADVDHVAGLLILREKQRFSIHATRSVLDVLDANPIFEVLDRELVARVPETLGTPFSPAPGLEVELFAVPGKVALYLEAGARDPDGRLATDAETENTVGARIRATDGSAEFFYVPGCARLSDDLAARLDGAALVLFDGTVWHDDEMQAQGLGQKTGGRMGHMAMNGAGGTIGAFADLAVGRKVFVHVNNSNPAWLPDGDARRTLAEHGWELAHDGMEITL